MAREIWHPAPCPDGVKAALRALCAGNANQGQQQTAMSWLMFDCCKIRDELFVPQRDRVDGARVTDYLLGRRSVGLQVARAIETKLGPVNSRGAPPAMPVEPAKPQAASTLQGAEQIPIADGAPGQPAAPAAAAEQSQSK